MSSPNLSPIVGIDGEHLPAVDAMNAVGSNGGAYRGGRFDRDMVSWAPSLRSPDAAILPDYKTLLARAYDLTNNDPTSAGAVQTQLDYVIGAGLRLAAKPDYKVLGVSAEEANEWARNTESRWRNFSQDPRCLIDAAERNMFPGLLGLGFRQYIVAGEILGTSEWMNRLGTKTAIQMIDTARLSNPNDLMDTNRLRGGVELGRHGEATAYHFREALESDMRFTGAKTYQWRRVPAKKPWGRKNVIHIYDQQRPGQTRGLSQVVANLAKSFKLGRAQDLTLDAMMLDAMYAAVIESEFDFAQVSEALGANSENSATDVATQAAQAMTAWHKSGTVNIDGAKIPHLYPGEAFKLLTSGRSGSSFQAFEKSFLKHLASGWNMSYEMVARDYSETNYAGARAGLQQAYKFFFGRRELIGGRFGSDVYLLWLEEEIDAGNIPLLGGIDFYDAPYAYSRCKWIGPGQDQVDRLKETNADVMELNNFMGTLEDKNAARGLDWEETMEQYIREIAAKKRMMDEYGISAEDLRMYSGASNDTSSNDDNSKDDSSSD